MTDIHVGLVIVLVNKVFVELINLLASHFVRETHIVAQGCCFGGLVGSLGPVVDIKPVDGPRRGSPHAHLNNTRL